MTSVADFHRVAYSLVGEARRVGNGRFGLLAVDGGFGTPPFPTGPHRPESQRRVRVVGDELCVGDDNAAERCERITTLRAGARLVGIAQPGTAAAEHDTPELGDVDRPLAVSAQVGETLGWWFALGEKVLGELASTAGAHDADEVQLWPGHFDIATAIGVAPDGSPADGAPAGRAAYGLSPGDRSHPEPYAYVGPWAEIDRADAYWNEEHFAGASLPYAEIAAAADPAGRVTEFLRAGYDRLNAARPAV